MQLKLLICAFILNCNLAKGNPSEKEMNFSGYMFEQVLITGTTNINNFQLWYNEDQFSDLSRSSNQTNNQLKICIPARSIESESKLMLNDFLQMIHVEKNPFITISMNEKPIDKINIGEFLKHQIYLTMNGTKKMYECMLELTECRQKEICLNGKLKVLLTDFEIDPPRKFFGMVRVKNEVFISFRLLFSTEKKETKN